MRKDNFTEVLERADSQFEVNHSNAIKILKDYYSKQKLTLSVREKTIILSRLGGYYADSDNLTLALARLKVAKELFEENKIDENSDASVMEEITLRIAHCLCCLGQYNTAIESLEKMLEQVSGLTRAHAFFILAKCYVALHTVDKAKYCFDQAISLYKNNGIDSQELLDVLIEKASFCLESSLSDFQGVAVSLKKLLNDLTVEYTVESKAVACLYVGMSNLNDSKYSDAVLYLNQACETLEFLYKKKGDPDWLVQLTNCKLYLAKTKWLSHDADGANSIIQSVIHSENMERIKPETQLLFLLCQISYGQKKAGLSHHKMLQVANQLLTEPQYAAIKNRIPAMFDAIGIKSVDEQNKILQGAFSTQTNGIFDKVKRSNSDSNLLKRLKTPPSHESAPVKRHVSGSTLS